MKKAPAIIPREVHLACASIGESIRAARIVRKLTQADLAERMSVSRDLVVRMEKGDPGISMGFYTTAMWSFNLLPQMVASITPENDAHGMHLRQQDKAQRVRDESSETISNTMDF